MFDLMTTHRRRRARKAALGAAPQQQHRPKMKVRIVTTIDAFAALGPAWDLLCGRCAQRSPFLSHAWLEAAWQWRSLSADLYVLCCERNGKLVGALPLVRERAAAGSALRGSLAFLAIPDTQRCDMLAEPGDASLVASAFANELLRRRVDWDVLRLRYLPAESIVATIFAAALSERGIRSDIRPAAANPRIALDTPWDAYYASRSRRLKKAINLATNRLAKAGRVEIHWLAPGTDDRAEVDRVVDDVIRISARSWKNRTGNSLDQAGPQAFIRNLSHSAHDQGWLSVWRLSLDGLPIAMEYQLIGDGIVYALRSDFDTDYEPLSPGSHLSRCMLETLFSHGLRHYLMGPGDNVYKYRWADTTETILAMTAYAPSLTGRALAAWELSLKPAARRMRDRFRPRVDTGTNEEVNATD